MGTNDQLQVYIDVFNGYEVIQCSASRPRPDGSGGRDVAYQFSAGKYVGAEPGLNPYGPFAYLAATFPGTQNPPLPLEGGILSSGCFTVTENNSTYSECVADWNIPSLTIELVTFDGQMDVDKWLATALGGVLASLADFDAESLTPS